MKPSSIARLHPRFLSLATLVLLPMLSLGAAAGPSSEKRLPSDGPGAQSGETEGLAGLDLGKLKKRFLIESKNNNGKASFTLEAIVKLLVECGMDEEHAKALKPGDYTALLQRALGGKEGDTKGNPTFDAGKSLIGKPVPQLTLDLLGGGKFDLTAHTGKEIVVLDFWASWCPPCVQSLPILAELSKTYGEKGVAFYAVNAGEDKETVRKFIESKKLNLAVALDPDGIAKEPFKLGGIPHLVIIDKTGQVQVVHVGFSSNYKEELSRELDALLSGKNPSQGS